MCRKIKFVPQENRNSGCGAACLAMVSGVSYDEALAKLFTDGRSRGLRTQYPQMRAGLRRLGIRHARKILKHRTWDAIETVSLVKCGVDQDGNWHWVIYDGKCCKLYDPLREGPTEPDGRSRRVSPHLPIYLD
jgi:hypothetical protein